MAPAAIKKNRRHLQIDGGGAAQGSTLGELYHAVM